MIQLRRSRRNLYVLITLGAWFLLAAGLFVWAGLQAAQYRAQVKSYAAEVKQIVVDTKNQFKTAHEQADTTAMHDQLLAFAAKLETKTQQAPIAPALFGLHIGGDDAIGRQQHINTAVKIYAADLRATAEYVDYQQKIALDLQLLSLKSAGNYDQIMALATAWQDTATAIKNRTTPAKLKDTSAALVQKMANVQSIIMQLGDLFKNNNTDGFAAKYTELQAAIAALKSVGEQMATVAAQYDAQLAKEAANLAKYL